MKNEKLQSLFNKHLQNNLTAAEAEELRSYIDDPESAEVLTNSIRNELIHFEENNEFNESQVDRIVDDLENKVLRTINQLRNTKNIKMRVYWNYAAAVAAIFLVAGTILYWPHYHIERTNELSLNTVNKDIPPGTSRATLILANGKSIALSKEMEGIAVSDNQIRYKNGPVLLNDLARQSFTLTVPKAGKYEVTLSDGTKVWLNSCSSITCDNDFKGVTRMVKMQGEIYLEVTHDSKRPFIVKAKGQDIIVLGTAFNVNTYNKGRAVTTLINGRIKLRTAGDVIKTLYPGDQAIVSEGIFDIHKVNVQDYLGWKDGLIVLNDQDIQDVFRQLERWYDVRFINMESIKAGKRLSGEIPSDTDLSVILNAIEEQLHLKFEINGRRIMIKI